MSAGILRKNFIHCSGFTNNYTLKSCLSHMKCCRFSCKQRKSSLGEIVTMVNEPKPSRFEIEENVLGAVHKGHPQRIAKN